MIVNAVIKGGGGLSGVRFDYDGFFEVRYGNVLALLLHRLMIAQLTFFLLAAVEAAARTIRVLRPI